MKLADIKFKVALYLDTFTNYILALYLILIVFHIIHLGIAKAQSIKKGSSRIKKISQENKK